MNNPNPTGCNVIETISVLKFLQVQGSLQLARKVELDQVAYKNEAKSLKSAKIQTFSRCSEGTIASSRLKFPQVQGSLQLARKVAQDQVAYENEPRGLKI